MLRSLVAPIAEYAALLVIVGVAIPLLSLALIPNPIGAERPPIISSDLVANLLVSFVAAILAGWVVARVVDRARLGYALALGLVVVAFGVYQPSTEPSHGQPSSDPGSSRP